jgi:phospholipase C
MARLENCAAMPNLWDRLEARDARRRHERSTFDLTAPRPDPSRPIGAHLLPAIAHIVVVMMENHSYDNYLGALGHGDGLPFTDDGRSQVSNRGADGRDVRPHRLTVTTQTPSFPCQAWEACHEQWDGGSNGGFVRNAERVAQALGADAAVADSVMGYWTDAELPFYAGLARTFPLADRWFGSCMGPTFPNRRFLVAATAHGLVTDRATHCFDTPAHGTIFDLLSGLHISWYNYHGSSPMRMVLSKLLGRHGHRTVAWLAPNAVGRPGALVHELESKLQYTADVYAVGALRHVRHVRGIKHFFRHVAEGRLPALSIVDPSFVDFSEETPQDIRLGERFAATVIDAVMRGPGWPSTLLVWCYDEHGGYYDHVPPPEAVEPDHVAPAGGGRYDRYGFRVPAVVVSPYARPEAVLHDTFDHTSILRLVEDTWNLPSLTRRDAAASSPIVALDLEAPPAFLVPPQLPTPALGYARPPEYDFVRLDGSS